MFGVCTIASAPCEVSRNRVSTSWLHATYRRVVGRPRGATSEELGQRKAGMLQECTPSAANHRGHVGP